MNEYGVITTLAEKNNPELELYDNPDCEGIFKLRLDHKAWFRKGGLKCYFTDVETGDKICLYAWRKERYVKGIPVNVYQPTNTNIDFSVVKLGSVWECEISLNSRGNLT